MWELLGDVYRGDAVFYAIRGNRERVNMLQALARGLPDGATKTETLEALAGNLREHADCSAPDAGSGMEEHIEVDTPNGREFCKRIRLAISPAVSAYVFLKGVPSRIVFGAAFGPTYIASR